LHPVSFVFACNVQALLSLIDVLLSTVSLYVIEYFPLPISTLFSPVASILEKFLSKISLSILSVDFDE